MSTDSGEDIIRNTGLANSTIITVNGSSTESALLTSVDGIHDDTDGMITSDVDEEGVSDQAGDDIVVPGVNQVTISSGDLNTSELEAFEKGMSQLNVTPDMNKTVSELPRTSEKYVNDKHQLFETCCFVGEQQKTRFPANPPKSCLMDQVTVST